MDKRIRRLSRRALVGVIVGLVFAAAAGVGLAQITSEPSTGTPSTSAPSVRNSRITTGAAEKVEVCHATGNGRSHTIKIARPAVAAHVAHGDTEGACATTTTAATTQTSPTTTTKAKKPRQPKKPNHVHSSVHASSTTHGNSSHARTHVSHSRSTHVSHTPHRNSGSSHGNGHHK